MNQIAFWGNVHGQVGSTSNVIAAATMIGIEYATRILVGQTQWSLSTLESAYSVFSAGEERNAYFTNAGIDALDRLARSNRLLPEMISDYTIPIINERLDLLMGTSKPTELLYDNMKDNITSIFSCAGQYYDAVLLDTHSGNRNSLTGALLETSDVIVVNLCQNMTLLERFFSKQDWPEALNKKPYMIVLGQYDPNSKYTAVNIARRFDYKDPIYTIPYCTDYKDACNDKRVLEFFIRQRNINRKHENYFFIQEIRRFIKALMSKVGNDMDAKVMDRRAS
ncbi:chromosome partitioning protein ParA [Paenibacillus albiflavus]|uniref:Chromosome partitioning protein ParA n=1 Tax=Paenibacillus albiflavus TaxID=2545760 RepID=A0A4R4ECT9_9BACL|nr:chromosome partitioning protein ParA [Paenibacillus albiflavus]TCZ77237.1 chromosome partitioning protein ParA [Paenibacillus albiflavus]